MKTFTLLKDLPDAKAGTKLTWSDNYGGYTYVDKTGSEDGCLMFARNVENNPEWFKKEEPIQGWEILSFKGQQTDFIYTLVGDEWMPDKQYYCAFPNTTEGIINSGAGIHSVRRISDNEVFTVGDKVATKRTDYNFYGCKITSFEIMKGEMYINAGDGSVSAFCATIDRVIKQTNPTEQPKEEPLPIKVESFARIMKGSKTWFEIVLSKEIATEKHVLIKKAIERELNNKPPSLPLPLVDDREVFSINDIASCYESPKDSPLYRALMYKLYRLLEFKISIKPNTAKD